jgi:nucleotide-binding universal stress UspA family protein
MFQRILVAVDGSETSNAALQKAVGLASTQQARLRVVHVIDSPYTYPDVLYGQVAVDLDSVRRDWREAGQRVLDHAAGVVRRAEVNAETALLESDGRRISSVIREEARRWGADLVVMGTHGRRGLERLLLGSVADGVARTSPVAVLLVPMSGS